MKIIGLFFILKISLKFVLYGPVDINPDNKFR